MGKYLYLIFCVFLLMLRKGKPIKKRKLQCELLFPAMSPSAFDVKQTRSGSRSPREQFWWHSREWNQTAVRGISEPRARASGKMASPLSPKGSSHYRIRLFQVKDFIIKVIPRDLQTKKTSRPHPHPKILWWGRSRKTAGDTSTKRGWNWNGATSQLLQSSWAPTDPVLWGQGHPTLEAGSFSWKWLLVHCSCKLLGPLSLRFFLFYKKWPCLQQSSFLSLIPAWRLPGTQRSLCKFHNLSPCHSSAII